MDEFILRKSIINFRCIPSFKELQGNIHLQLPKYTCPLFSLNFYSESSLIKFYSSEKLNSIFKHNQKQVSIYYHMSKNNETGPTNQIL